MDININQIIDYYAQATVNFVDIFTNTMEPGRKDTGRTTAPGKCGLVFPLAGSASFSFNGIPYAMVPGMVVHAGPQMPIEIQATGDKIWEYAVVHYIPSKDMVPFSLANQHFAIHTGDYSNIINLVQQLKESYAMPGSMAILKSKAIFMNLVEAILISAKMKILDSANEMMEQVVQYIHEYYARPLSVSNIAQAFGVERRRLAYLFEQHTGMNPSSYLTEYRIRRAKDLLRYCNFTVAEIAECVGYVDSFYFSRVFKKNTGMSPTAFRKLMMEEAKYV